MDGFSCVRCWDARRGRAVFLYVMGSPRDSLHRLDWWRGGYWGTPNHVKVGITHDVESRLLANRRAYGYHIGVDAVCWAVFELGQDRQRAGRIETRVLQALRLRQRVLHLHSHRVKLCDGLGHVDFLRNYSGRGEVFNMSAGEALEVLRLVVPFGREIQYMSGEFDEVTGRHGMRA